MTLLARLVVRTLVLSVVYVLALVVIDSSETTDPLGAGLLVFLVFVVIALVWGLTDGRRGPAGRAIVVWFVAGALLGVVTSIGIAVRETGAGDLVEDLTGSVPFFALLIGVPAALGVAVGAGIRRATS